MVRLYCRYLLTGVVNRSLCALPRSGVQEMCDALNKEYPHIYHWVEAREWFAHTGSIVTLPNEHVPTEKWKLN